MFLKCENTSIAVVIHLFIWPQQKITLSEVAPVEPQEHTIRPLQLSTTLRPHPALSPAAPPSTGLYLASECGKAPATSTWQR
jgi:hypothetical protein